MNLNQEIKEYRRKPYLGYSEYFKRRRIFRHGKDDDTIMDAVVFTLLWHKDYLRQIHTVYHYCLRTEKIAAEPVR